MSWIAFSSNKDNGSKVFSHRIKKEKKWSKGIQRKGSNNHHTKPSLDCFNHNLFKDLPLQSLLLLSSERNINCNIYNKITLRATWIHCPSNGEISFFRLSLIIPYIFSRKAVSCCLNNNAGYLASTCRKSSSLPRPRPLRKDESPALWGDDRNP